jgi:nicotinate-nucleotide adenylyltransferase
MTSAPDAAVGLFGGSFNPPHLGHQVVCLYALATGEVSSVLMVPTYRHAFDKELAPYEDRFHMCELAAAPFRGLVEVSRIEEEIGGERSRTYDTLQALAAARPDARFRLVIGSDILHETEAWHRWDDVIALAPPLVVPRAGWTVPGAAEPLGFSATSAAAPAAAAVIPAISSTAIRELLSRGESALPLVPRAVMDYIAGRGLYRC